MGVCAVENSMLFILDIISALHKSQGEPGVPCCGLKAKGFLLQLSVCDLQWFQQPFAGRTHGVFKENFGN
jgi:hypothetical protein